MLETRYIDRHSLNGHLAEFVAKHLTDRYRPDWNDAIGVISSEPDAPILRCRDCRLCEVLYGGNEFLAGWCRYFDTQVDEDFYCANLQRR